jgi:Domain of Unknown Function (DUF1080)
MRSLCLVLAGLAAWPVFAAGDGRFNGRWDITGYPEPRSAAWWVEIAGADTDSPTGKFVTAFNGDMNVIQEISVKPGELQFGFTRPNGHMVYKARLKDTELEGTFEIEGQKQPATRWVAVRAPVIPDKDDGTWREGKPVTLFNGKDLTGWTATGPGAITGWSAHDGTLATTGKGINIITAAKFWNFKLHAEVKVAEHSNSGIGLRARYEVQVLDDFGRPPNTHGNGALYARILPSENASKPAGEWQTYDIRLVGRQVTVVLNGKTIIDKGEVEGLTAIAIDSHEAEPGPIFLQGDHGAVEFRNLMVTPLVKK